VQRRAAQLAPDVAGGQVHAVATHLSGRAFEPAVDSFLQGFEVALLLSAGVLVVGGFVGFRACGTFQISVSADRHATDVALRK